MGPRRWQAAATRFPRAVDTPGVTACHHVPNSVPGPAAAGDTAATFPPASRVGQPRTTRQTTKPGRAAHKGRVVCHPAGVAGLRARAPEAPRRPPPYPPAVPLTGREAAGPAGAVPAASLRGQETAPHSRRAGERASRELGARGRLGFWAETCAEPGPRRRGPDRAGGLTAAQRQPGSSAAAMAQPACTEARAREASSSPVKAARSRAVPRLRHSERICS